MTMSSRSTTAALLDRARAGRAGDGDARSHGRGRHGSPRSRGPASAAAGRHERSRARARHRSTSATRCRTRRFIDQDDRRRAFSEWRGTPTLVTFIYTRCPLPTFCPLMDQNFATIQRAIAEDPALRGRVRLDLDLVRSRARHAGGARGARGETARPTRRSGRFSPAIASRSTVRRPVRRRPDPARPTPTEITHNLRTMLIGADGRVVGSTRATNGRRARCSPTFAPVVQRRDRAPRRFRADGVIHARPNGASIAGCGRRPRCSGS